MGIPAQKHLVSGDLPDGYEKRTEGTVQQSDLVWSTSEAKYMDVSEFSFIIGEPVSEFWAIAKKQ